MFIILVFREVGGKGGCIKKSEHKQKQKITATTNSGYIV